MPRKKKDEKRFQEVVEETPDNTIEFPTSAQDPAGRTEQEVDQANQLAIQLIDKNRKEGLEGLEKKCDNFKHRELISTDRPVNENDLRDIEGAIKSIMTSLEAINSLIDMIRHDMVVSVQNIEQQAMGQFQVSAHLQTLIAVLVEKEFITDDEMKATWEKVVKERVKALRDQAQQK